MKSLKIKISIVLIVVLCITSSVFAYSQSLSFTVSSWLYTNYAYTLEKKNTYSTANADTYYYDGNYASTCEYTINLQKQWSLSKFGTLTPFQADGYTVTKGYGAVPAATYRVEFTKTGSSGDYIDGTDSLTQ